MWSRVAQKNCTHMVTILFGLSRNHGFAEQFSRVAVERTARTPLQNGTSSGRRGLVLGPGQRQQVPSKAGSSGSPSFIELFGVRSAYSCLNERTNTKPA